MKTSYDCVLKIIVTIIITIIIAVIVVGGSNYYFKKSLFMVVLQSPNKLAQLLSDLLQGHLKQGCVHDQCSKPVSLAWNSRSALLYMCASLNMCLCSFGLIYFIPCLFHTLFISYLLSHTCFFEAA